MRHYSLPFAALAAALVLAPAAHAQSALTQDPAQVQAGAYVLDPGHSKITWSVNHFGFSTYLGQFSTVNGKLKLDPKSPQASNLQVTVDTNSLGTLNSALDTHVKSADFLDVARFPQASFKATSVKLTGARTADIAGDLTLHGVTRPVVLQAKFNQAGSNPVDKKYSLGFSGSAVVKRTDFGIKTYAPYIGDDVTLQIEAEFKAAD